jgi:type II secretory pathway component PulF
VLPIADEATARWYLERGLQIPLYPRTLLGIALFSGSFGWLLALPMVSVLFTIALFRSNRAATEMNR